MKQGMLMFRWINIIDRECDPLCKVCIRVDNQKSVERRLHRMRDVLTGIQREFVRMGEIDPDGKRFDKLNELEQKTIEAVQNGFGIRDAAMLSPLFEKHRPTETVNGEAFFASVVKVLMSGMQAAINGRKQSVTVRIAI